MAVPQIPSSGCWFGSHCQTDAQRQGTRNVRQEFDYRESQLGRQIAFPHTFKTWSSADANVVNSDDLYISSGGRPVYIHIRPNGIQMTAITAGNWDSKLNDWFDCFIANNTKAILVGFHHEGESPRFNQGTAAQFVAAFRYIVTKCRNYVQTGTGLRVTNVAWAPGYMASSGATAWTSWFPGDSYCDWVFVDGYSYPVGGTRKPTAIFDNFYNWAATHTVRPLAIGETGTSEYPTLDGSDGHSKQDFFDSIVPYLKTRPNFKALFYFNANDPGDPAPSPTSTTSRIWLWDNGRPSSTLGQATMSHFVSFAKNAYMNPSFGASTAPANTSLPAISGTANVGNPLTVDAGQWSGNPAPAYAYQWRRITAGSSGPVTLYTDTFTKTAASSTWGTGWALANGTAAQFALTGTTGTVQLVASSAVVHAQAHTTDTARQVRVQGTMAYSVVSAGTDAGAGHWGVLILRYVDWANHVQVKFIQNKSGQIMLEVRTLIAGANTLVGTATAATHITSLAANATANIAAEAIDSGGQTTINVYIWTGAATLPASPDKTVTITTNQVAGGVAVGASNSTSGTTTAAKFTFDTVTMTDLAASTGAATTNVGTNSDTYTPVTGDVGATIDCVVTASNTAGSASATAPPTAAVTNVAVTLPGTPTFSPAPATTLTEGANWTLSWTSTNATSFEYQYDGGLWIPISGGPGGTFTAIAPSVGTHTFRVRGLNASGTGAASAVQTVTVATAGGLTYEISLDNGAPVPIGSVTQYRWPNPPVGLHTFRVRAKNAAGQVSAYSTSTFTVVPAGVSDASIPDVRLECAFGYGPNDDIDAITWTDVTRYLRGGNTRRGRNHELDPFEAGTATFRLSNRDRRFDPTNTAGPYGTGLLPEVPVRCYALWQGARLDIFTGFVETWPPLRSGPRESEVEITCSDAFDMLSNDSTDQYLQASSTGARIGNLLDLAGWPIGNRNIDDGFGRIQEHNSGGEGVFEPILALIQEAEIVEGGQFYVTAGGGLIFEDRQSRILSNLDILTFGDLGDGTELPYKELSIEMNRDEIRNKVIVTVRVPEGLAGEATPQIAEDLASEQRYLRRVHQIDDIPLATDDDAFQLASFLLSRYKDPNTRITNLATSAHMDWDLLGAALLGMEIGQRVAVVHRPPGGGSPNPVTITGYVEGVEHTFTSEGKLRWDTNLNISPSAAWDFWILGDASRGKLGLTTKLGY